MIALGVDPGFAAVGLSAVELSPSSEKLMRCWVFRTEPSEKKREVRASEDSARRTRELAEVYERAIGVYRPTVICAETMSWPRNAGAVAKVALSWGALCAVLQRHNLPLVQASPQEVKKALCGRKDASKEDVALAIEQRFPNVEWPKVKGLIEHAADATAVVVACLNSEVIRLARRMAA